MRGRIIEPLTRADGDPIAIPAHVNARVLPVETNFHRMARRPGGVSRQEALSNARKECQRVLRRTLRAARKA
jgi:endonuclease III